MKKFFYLLLLIGLFSCSDNNNSSSSQKEEPIEISSFSTSENIKTSDIDDDTNWGNIKF